jgi:hypothetical protein
MGPKVTISIDIEAFDLMAFDIYGFGHLDEG